MSTASQSPTVAAYFQQQSDAQNAIRDLQAAGFRSDQIATSFDDFDQEDWGDVTKRPQSSFNSESNLTSDQYSPNSANASAAGHEESFWDKVKDFFSGETADSDINDHTIVNRDHQDITDRAWRSSGIRIPDSYDTRLQKGGGLVTVHASGRADEAEKILARNGGEIDRNFKDEDFGKYELEGGQAVGTPGTAYSGSTQSDVAAGMGQGTRADITGGEVGTPLSDRAQNLRQDEERVGDNMRAGALESSAEFRNASPERRIQLISEVLRVRKERVARGEVRLRKEVRTETQNIQVPVTHEEIVIERNPVSGERTATGQIGADKEIRVPLSEERVKVEKVPVVTEEVKVGKRTVSNTENVQDQVRREELNVEGADENVRGNLNRKENETIRDKRDKDDPSRKIA